VSHLLYVGMLAGCLVGTAPLELWLGVRVYRQWRRLILTLVPTALVFGAWDVYAISRHQWRYVDHWLVGIRLPGSLPLEEVLFFLVIPTCSILTLEAVRSRRPHWVIGDER
jgi:lycopene cyclase domain-containing protein